MTVEDVIGGPPVRVTVGGFELPATQLGGVSIRHGREGFDEQPKPAVCSLGALATAMPRLPVVGDPVEVELTEPALVWALGPANVFEDGSFETGTAGWNPSTNSPTVSNPATALATHGGKVLRAVATAAGPGSMRVHSPLVTVTPGEQLTFAYDIQAETATRNSAPQVQFYAANGSTAVGGLTQLANSSKTATVGTWVRCAGSITVPDGAYRARLFLFVSAAVAGDAFLFDAVMGQRGTTAGVFTTQTETVRNVARPRFTGHVTDVRATGDRPGTPAEVHVTAVSRRARLGRTFVGDSPWPAELDGARAQRILTLAAPAVGATVGTVDGGAVTVLARDVDRRTAQQLLDELAVDADALLVEYRDGRLSWHDAHHRNVRDVDVTLAAGQVLAQVEAVQQLSGLLNELRVSYGVAPEGGDRPAVTYTDPDSQAEFGPFAAQLSGQLATEADALDYARRAVGRRSRPAWTLSQLRLDLTRTVDPATAGALLRLEVADLLSVVNFPAVGPFAAPERRLWVEGWSEVVTRHGWQLDLAVSDYGRSGTEPRWVDLNPAKTWQDATITWLQSVSWDSYAT